MGLVVYGMGDTYLGGDECITISLIKNGSSIDELCEKNLYRSLTKFIRNNLKNNNIENIKLFREFIIKQLPIGLPSDILIDIIEKYV